MLMLRCYDKSSRPKRKRPALTAEQIAEMQRKMIEDGTPLPGNVCKTEGCGGRVVRIYGGGKIPQCKKCGRYYPHAKSAPLVGVEEHVKLMNQPMTI